MLKKSLAFILSLLILSLCCSCAENKPEESSSAPSSSALQDDAREITKAEDLVGVWRIEIAWPENEAAEFGEELGITNFKTTAKMVSYIELKNDGTASYLKDFDLMMSAAMDCYYTIFYEAFSEAKKVTDAETFKNNVENSYGYECFNNFSQKAIPEHLKDSESHIKFFEMAYDEMTKYKDSPLETQAAIGALWGEMLEEIGSGISFANGEWVANNKYDSSWSFSDGTLILNESEYTLKGDTKQFELSQADRETKIVWIRYAQ